MMFLSNYMEYLPILIHFFVFVFMDQGLYPEAHGIIANEFYDPEFGAKFEVGNDESLKSRWWGGEPLWNTVNRQVSLWRGHMIYYCHVQLFLYLG